MRSTKLRWIKCLGTGVLLYLLSSPFLFATPEKQSTSLEKNISSHAQDLHLMLYTHSDKSTSLSGLALVKDQRSFSFMQGLNAITINNVSSFLIPSSILIRLINASKDTDILEQNFHSNDISWETLQKASLGKEIYFHQRSCSKSNTDSHSYSKGKLISYSSTNDTKTSTADVLVEKDGIVFRVNSRDLAYVLPPEEKNAPPHVTLDIDSKSTQNNVTLELSYLTPGISWSANYIGEVNEDISLLDITGWVTLTNQTHISYPHAHITLASYDPLLPSTQNNIEAIYSLPHPVSLTRNEPKQVLLFRITDLPIKLSYKLNIDKEIFTHDETSRPLKSNIETWAYLPHPKQFSEQLPQGELRLYQRMKEGNLEFLGNNTVLESTEKEGINLRLGISDDIRTTQEQTDFKMLRPQLFESGYVYTLENTSPHPITVDIIASLPGEWQILRESQPHETIPTNFPLWKLKISPNSKAELRYRVRIGLPVES